MYKREKQRKKCSIIKMGTSVEKSIEGIRKFQNIKEERRT